MSWRPICRLIQSTRTKTNASDLTHCEACGTLKLAHNMCPNCYSQITRRWKQEAREPLTKRE